MRGERMLVRSAGMTELEVVAMLIVSSGGSIIDTPDRSHKPSTGWRLCLLVVEVTSLLDIVMGVVKVLTLVSALALFPGVPMVMFKVLLYPDLTILEGVPVCMVLFPCWGVGGIPRAWVLFLATEALQESSKLAGRGLVRSCLAWFENLRVDTVSCMSRREGEMQATMVMMQWDIRLSFNTLVRAESL